MVEFEPDSRICVGRIAGAHGIQGWVRITSYTEEPTGVAAYGPVSDDKGERMFELEIMRMAKAQVVARIPGVTDRNAAEALRGMRLFVPRAVLPAPDADEFYFDDLTGLSVETTDGVTLGAVISVQDFGTGPMLEVGETRGATILVPFTHDVVPVVDLVAGRIEIDPPFGLLEPVENEFLLESKEEEQEADHGNE
ncbi:ribosome maturation factor RimM [Alphaproteobacteria bacterium]|nr:ribosome maturation factor RimM [Alphaproteobacteria bacterium]